MIGNDVVTLNSELISNGLTVFEGRDEDDAIYICKGEQVVYKLTVDAFCGEGGGGSINIVKVD